jgi:hypothetical protein
MQAAGGAETAAFYKRLTAAEEALAAANCKAAAAEDSAAKVAELRSQLVRGTLCRIRCK